jgi:hypothetical protein
MGLGRILKDSNWRVEPVEEVGLGVRQEPAVELILDNSWKGERLGYQITSWRERVIAHLFPKHPIISIFPEALK